MKKNNVLGKATQLVPKLKEVSVFVVGRERMILNKRITSGMSNWEGHVIESCMMASSKIIFLMVPIQYNCSQRTIA